MIKIDKEIKEFFYKHGCVIVTTIDKGGFPHSSCKGIIEMKANGKVFLLDLYKGKTFENLRRNPHISITAFDEHKFCGYCLKGKAVIITRDKINPRIMKLWEEKITDRLTKRLLRNVREEKSHTRHPEVLLPKPQYLICVESQEIVDLTPSTLKEE